MLEATGLHCQQPYVALAVCDGDRVQSLPVASFGAAAGVVVAQVAAAEIDDASKLRALTTNVAPTTVDGVALAAQWRKMLAVGAFLSFVFLIAFRSLFFRQANRFV